MLGLMPTVMACILTIAEEREIRACNYSNSNVELSALEAIKLAHLV